MYFFKLLPGWRSYQLFLASKKEGNCMLKTSLEFFDAFLGTLNFVAVSRLQTYSMYNFQICFVHSDNLDTAALPAICH